MRATPILMLVAAGLLAATAGHFYRQHGAAASAEPAVAAGPPLPAATQLTDLDGTRHSFGEWRGKLLLVNFWATWCAPCLKEIPLLVQVQKDYGPRGLQIVGPAIDDPDEVRKAAKGPLAINYPVIVGTQEQMLGLLNEVGNTVGALPFTLLVAADGTVVHQQLGEFSVDELRKLVEAHLPK